MFFLPSLSTNFNMAVRFSVYPILSVAVRAIAHENRLAFSLNEERLLKYLGSIEPPMLPRYAVTDGDLQAMFLR